MKNEIINYQCSVCGGYTMDDGTSELCWCDDELEELFEEAINITEQAIEVTANKCTKTEGENEC